MEPFIKYADGNIEDSYLCHMFYIASLGFRIVPGTLWVNGIALDYESVPEGIKLMKKDGGEMVLTFEEAMALVSKSQKQKEAQ
jgi:hypothetical protein